MNNQNGTPSGDRNNGSFVLRVNPNRISMATHRPVVHNGKGAQELLHQPVLTSHPKGSPLNPILISKHELAEQQAILSKIKFAKPFDFDGFVFDASGPALAFVPQPNNRWKLQIGSQNLEMVVAWQLSEPLTLNEALVGLTNWVSKLRHIPEKRAPTGFDKTVDSQYLFSFNPEQSNFADQLDQLSVSLASSRVKKDLADIFFDDIDLVLNPKPAWPLILSRNANTFRFEKTGDKLVVYRIDPNLAVMPRPDSSDLEATKIWLEQEWFFATRNTFTQVGSDLSDDQRKLGNDERSMNQLDGRSLSALAATLFLYEAFSEGTVRAHDQYADYRTIKKFAESWAQEQKQMPNLPEMGAAHFILDEMRQLHSQIFALLEANDLEMSN